MARNYFSNLTKKNEIRRDLILSFLKKQWECKINPHPLLQTCIQVRFHFLGGRVDLKMRRWDTNIRYPALKPTWTTDVSNLRGWRESDDDDAHVVPAALVEASVDHLVADGLQVVVHLHHGELENLVLTRNFHIIHFPSSHFVNFRLQFLHSPSYLARIEIMTILPPRCACWSMDIYHICI